MGIIAVLVLALLNFDDVIALTMYNVTACFESSNQCGELQLDKCSNNSMMYLSEMKYGTKNESDIISCNETEQACFKDGVGCCSHSESDCFHNYTARNAYAIYKKCSGKSECVSRAAGNVVSCFKQYDWTTYSTIWYSCINVSDVIRFCDDVSTITKSAHILFDKKHQSSLCGRSNCSCFLTSTEILTVTYIDVRMAKMHTDKTNSDCSSAVLVSDRNIYTNVQCNRSLDEYEHFVYKYKNQTSVSKLTLELRDLYANGLDDSPEFVWILIEAHNEADINVTCWRPTPTCTTITISTDKTTTSITNTASTSTNTTSTDSTSTITNSTENTSPRTIITESTTTSSTTSESVTTNTPTYTTTSYTTSTMAAMTAKSEASSRVAVISGVAASTGLLVLITLLAVCAKIIKRRRMPKPETKENVPIESAMEHTVSDGLPVPDYDNAPDLRLIRLRDGYVDFALRGHLGSHNTALAWPSNSGQQRPVLPTRPQLSERNSRHNLPEPRPCRNVSNLHHLRATKKDVDGRQLLYRGPQSRDREQEVFDYMKPVSDIWPLSPNDLPRNSDRIGNGDRTYKSCDSHHSNEVDSMDGTSKLLARKMFKIDGQDVHSIVIDMRLVMNK